MLVSVADHACGQLSCGAAFTRRLRLLSAASYNSVFASRKVLRGACFALHYHPNGLDHPRLGLVIPKKQARKAVLRNAVKRQARELFRRRQASLPAVDVVLRLARPPVGAPAILAGKMAAKQTNKQASPAAPSVLPAAADNQGGEGRLAYKQASKRQRAANSRCAANGTQRAAWRKEMETLFNRLQRSSVVG